MKDDVTKVVRAMHLVCERFTEPQLFRLQVREQTANTEKVVNDGSELSERFSMLACPKDELLNPSVVARFA
jgi:hypothetical protein